MEEERCITRDKIKFQEENVCPVKKNGKTPRLVPDLLFLLFPRLPWFIFNLLLVPRRNFRFCCEPIPLHDIQSFIFIGSVCSVWLKCLVLDWDYWLCDLIYRLLDFCQESCWGISLNSSAGTEIVPLNMLKHWFQKWIRNEMNTVFTSGISGTVDSERIIT